VRAHLLALALLATTTATATAREEAPAARLGPGATVRQKNEAMMALVRGGGDKQKELHALAATLLDYTAFARASLVEHWDRLKKRDELVATFKQMLEARYLAQLRSQLDSSVSWVSEEVEGAEATVTTLVQHQAKNRTFEEEVVYKLHRGGDGAWRVHDIVSDEISLVRNYKAQFHKIINERGADKLTEMMKSKL
jgi:phospholipid transport system substrate-binding protein